jgi:serine/threonine-protein kinase
MTRLLQASNLSELSLTGKVGGTPAFLPPEQVTNFRGAKPAADQYGAAATLYYLLTRHIPFRSHDTLDELLRMILEAKPIPVRDRRPDVPEALAKAIHRALAKDPEKRFPDVRSFRKALAPFSRRREPRAEA